MGENPPRPVAEARARSSWNARFEHWEKPASPSEEMTIERTAAAINAALANNSWLNGEGVLVTPQGSYHNNTNVRLASDMDIRVQHPGIMLMTGPGVTHAHADRQLGYWATGESNFDIASRLRHEIASTLKVSLGEPGVRIGTKAISIGGSDWRCSVDVVPVLTLDYAFHRWPHFGSEPYLERVRGVVIYAADGTRIANFPDQHLANGKAKRERTASRFKKCVRMLKRLRDELVELGEISANQAPSFLIECLCYRVEDEHYLYEEDRYERLRRLLYRMHELLRDPLFVLTANEISDIKLLFFHGQGWTEHDANTFVNAAWQRLNATP